MQWGRSCPTTMSPKAHSSAWTYGHFSMHVKWEMGHELYGSSCWRNGIYLTTSSSDTQEVLNRYWGSLLQYVYIIWGTEKLHMLPARTPPDCQLYLFAVEVSTICSLRRWTRSALHTNLDLPKFPLIKLHWNKVSLMHPPMSLKANAKLIQPLLFRNGNQNQYTHKSSGFYSWVARDVPFLSS